ncbi:MAG TPA: FG-GAP-like repeat-containing protein [Gemmataceae bacterium]
MPVPSRHLSVEQLESRDAPAVFTVTSAADSGPGSLRQAILDANARPGADTIRFQIASGTQTITPATALPTVTDPVVLDATTQPGYAGKPLIVLDGSAAPVGASGLVLSNHTGSTIRGFEIINFSKDFTGTFVNAAGINIQGGGGHTIQGNYIGTDGTAADPNGYAGILVNTSAGNLIGGTTAAARNVIAGNRRAGVYIANPLSTGNKVQGNYVGTDATGTHALPNGMPTLSIGGVVIAGFGPSGAVPVGHNTIGGTAPGAGNLIAFERFAVQIVGSSGNPVEGNSLHDNGTGILLDSTFRANDAGDADGGGDNRQNQPVITGTTGVTDASKKVVNTSIAGTLDSAPNTQFRIELFRSTKTGADTWGNGQGETVLGAVTVTTDANGHATFTFLAPPLSGGYVVATATNVATGDTSPFSPPVFTPVIDPVGGGPGGDGQGYALGAATGAPRVWLYNGDGTLKRTFLAYDASFKGGVRVATADVNGDGVLDVVTGAGPGGGPHIKVFDGATGALLTQFFAFDPRFSGGVSVAAADVNGDGKADIVVGAGPGGGPNVRVLSGATGAVLRNFFAYAPSFRGGVSVAAGDVNGDGKADIITGAGRGGGPHLRVWSGATGQLLAEGFAYAPSYTGGLSVAAGDFDGDGKADIAVGPLNGGPARVRVLSGTLAPLKDIQVYQDDYRGGTTIAMRDTDGDGSAELLVAVKAHGKPEVFDVRPTGTPTDALTPDAAAPEGVFIG